MIVGIGIDIIELARVEAIINRNDRFSERILTKKEYEQFLALKGKRKVEYLAGRFSAKEAFSKAYGTGIGKEVGFLDIEILSAPNGKPYIVFREEDLLIHVSISHSQDYAVSQVIIERISINK